MRISIVIRCFNEAEHIGRLLSGIEQQTRVDREVILVDSGSTDATLSIVSDYPVQILHIDPADFSFGRSLNLGCRVAGGNVIVIASGHVYPVNRDWLERLIAPFEDERIALVYGKQRGDKRTRFSEHQVFAHWFGEASDMNQAHTFCNNANAAIRRSVWQELPYDETLTGLEDIDWAKRATQRGYQIAYSAEAEVIHVHSETPARIFNRYRREAIALRSIYPEQRFGLGSFLRFFFGNAISDARQARRGKVLRRELPGIVQFRLMQFWGTFRGHARHGEVTQQLKKTFYYPLNGGLDRPAGTEHDADRRIDYEVNPTRPIRRDRTGPDSR